MHFILLGTLQVNKNIWCLPCWQPYPIKYFIIYNNNNKIDEKKMNE